MNIIEVIRIYKIEFIFLFIEGRATATIKIKRLKKIITQYDKLDSFKLGRFFSK